MIAGSMDERQRYDQIWMPVAVRTEPPEGDLADELHAWLRDATPEDLWRALRCVYAGSRAGGGRMGYRRSPRKPAEYVAAEERARAKEQAK
jgi:hypothetical protein